FSFIHLKIEQLKFPSELSEQYNRAEDLENYRRFTIQYKQAIKNAKKVANDNAINTARNPTKCMWNIINQKRGKKKETEENCLLPKDFSNFFAQVVDKLIDEIPKTKDDPLEYLKGLSPPVTEFLFRELTLVELRDIINQMKNKKSSDI
ncbi:hypothetical protein HHI36_021838, partial [Cryptolaemus montrouzieri]